jgi:hypothetical protein
MKKIRNVHEKGHMFITTMLLSFALISIGTAICSGLHRLGIL